jgi:hypothetical protein
MEDAAYSGLSEVPFAKDRISQSFEATHDGAPCLAEETFALL